MSRDDADTDVAVVGGGIVGVALAARLAGAGGRQVTLLEKEPELARHQTGHNSGVVHAGIYYPPGSLKAKLCRRGATLVREFTARHALPFEECGKLIVATDDAELPRLRALLERAIANEVPDIRMVDALRLTEIEPHARGLAALHSPHTAITDYAAITRALADEARAAGATIRTGYPVEALSVESGRVLLRGAAGVVRARRAVICAGLGSDRLARQAGDSPTPAIVPFRGEYYLLRGEAAARVNGLIYPVPDPRLPFLGVHLTRRVDGSVLVGPNAVLATAREGYAWSRVNLRDLAELAGFPGTWRLLGRHWRAAGRELASSASRAVFAAQARRYLPALRSSELHRGPSGVRAQAVDRDGALVDDFRLSRCGPVLAVRNAPSPGATSALALAEHLADAL